MELINLKTNQIIDIDDNINNINNNSNLDICKKMMITIGAFDGLHLAHQKIIESLNQQKNGDTVLYTGVMTFDPHPDYVLNKRIGQGYITPLKDKMTLLKALGVDYLILIHFTLDIAHLSHEDYYNRFLSCFYGFVIGYDFRFGKNALGDASFLLSKNPNTLIINKIDYQNQKCSSTLVRSFLEQGNVKEVANILGKPYQVTGMVTTGAHIGSSLGFPTANIELNNEFMSIKDGVYFVQVTLQHKDYYGMANIGQNPTLNYIPKKRLEVNLFDFNLNIYGETIVVSFLDYLRGELKLNNKIELIEQMKKDKEKCLLMIYK